MAEYSEEPYQEEFGGSGTYQYSGNYEESGGNYEASGGNYKGFGNYAGSGNYNESENYGGNYKGSGNYVGSGNYEVSENYGGNYNGSGNYVGSGNYGGSGSYEELGNNEGREDYGGSDARPRKYFSSSLKEKLKEKIIQEKSSYEQWDADSEWRPFRVIPRLWWRAEHPSHSAPFEFPLDMVILTYTQGRYCTNTYNCSREVNRLQNIHLQNGAVDIAFNFLIGGNGTVFEGRGWHNSPRLSHKLQRYSRRALHVGLLGNLREVMPSDKMLEATGNLMKLGVNKGFIAPKFLEYTTRLWNIPNIPTESGVLNSLVK